MKRSYMDYSMSVIVSRALPDVRDGLKPVHRRILYSMFEQSLTHRRPYKKSAAVVGDVLGKYHPHGDSAVYDAMVRMAQQFSLLYPLVDGQGNFGSLDGDPAAAYRYTEARMSRVGEELLSDIDKDTVDFAPNFDGRLEEPVVMPAGLPNLLVNGSAGIAVGMATNIPPHNLGEVVEACCRLIEDPRLDDERLLEVVKGPDFPVGGIVMGTEGIKEAYLTGHGKMTIRGRVSDETTPRDRVALVVNEIPYQVNKAKLISKIADLVREKKIKGIADLRDESDREGTRVVIELKQDAVKEVVLNQLYEHSALQTTFGANMLALVGDRPRRLTLREMLECFLEHRHDVVLRKTRFDLDKARQRAHIVEGLLKALDEIDRVIELVRGARNREEAQAALTEEMGFSEEQSRAILDMRLHRLTGLESEELRAEREELAKTIEELEKLVSSRSERMNVVGDQLREISEKYAQPRRTTIETDFSPDLTVEDLIPNDSMVVMISHSGYIKRLSLDTYRSQQRGGRGIIGATTRDEDFLEQVFVAGNHSYILFFTNQGRCHWLKVFQVPEARRTSRGKALVNLIDLEENERPVAHVCVKEFDEDRFVLMATSNGLVKKTPLSAYGNPRRVGIWAIRLDEGSELIGATLTSGSSEVLLAKRLGQANRFAESEVRPMGRHTRGVVGIRTEEDDRLVSMVVADDPTTILTITENGYGKRTLLEDYRLTKRATKGVINIKCSERNGPVTKAMQVTDEDELILVSARGMVIRVPAEQISIIGRNTQGVRLMNLPDGDRVVDAARVPVDEAEDDS
ncbi:DNA gyrase subunit A [Candidatus Fermentibacteria bacterium]|nr:DNA gyrase subunit A [Candidatus Fermentibacteria bacterium]